MGRPGVLTVVGAVLPVVLGASLGSITTHDGRGTWSYPVQPTAFLLLSIGLVASHLLVLVGLAEVARRSEGTGARLVGVAAVGSALVAVCELWSGLVATSDLDAPVITALSAGYAVSSVTILLGTLGGAVALRRTRSAFAAPLLLNGVVLLVATPIRFLGSDDLGIAALTLWSLTYVWLGVRLGIRRPVARVEARPV